MLRGLMEKVKVIPTVLAQNIPSAGGAITGSVVDTQGYGSCFLVFNVGANGDTYSASNKYSLEVLVSDDNVTYVPAADSDLYSVASAGGAYASPAGTIAASGGVVALTANSQASQAYKIGYRGYHRYVKGKVNLAGTLTVGTPMSCEAIMGHPQLQPVS